MAGIDVGGGGGGGRRTLDAELNCVPMIDLMMVTISFLLITAVWTQMSRMNATANVPHEGPPIHVDEPARALHVEMKRDLFVVSWRDAATVVERFDVPRHDVVAHDGEARRVRFPELADRLRETWQASGAHRSPSDAARDRAVLHVEDEASYAEIVGAMDAIAAVRRDKEAAFAVAFAER